MHAEWPQDFLHDYTLVNHGNHPHYVLADWATERVGVPDLHNDVAPFLRGQVRGGGGIILGRKGLEVASIAELGWRPPRILLLYQP